MKKLSSVLALSLLFATTAFAHGNTKPLHGGELKMVGELTFELVNKAGVVELYVVDDGEDVDSAAATAKLIIASGGNKTEVALQSAGGNKFEAKTKIASGAQVTVLYTDKTTQAKTTASFTIQ